VKTSTKKRATACIGVVANFLVDRHLDALIRTLLGEVRREVFYASVAPYQAERFVPRN
jgi:hypothetical protein